MKHQDIFLLVGVVLGMFIIMTSMIKEIHEQGVIKGQKMALSGDVIIHQVTNEYNEVKWVNK